MKNFFQQQTNENRIFMLKKNKKQVLLKSLTLWVMLQIIILFQLEMLEISLHTGRDTKNIKKLEIAQNYL